MRRERSPEELLANWAPVDGDWYLVANKSGVARLGFSLMLKFFELEGRFPDVLEEVPPTAVEYAADLVKVPAIGFDTAWWAAAPRVRRTRRSSGPGPRNS